MFDLQCRFAAPRVSTRAFNWRLFVYKVPVLNVVNVRDVVHRLPASSNPLPGKG